MRAPIHILACACLVALGLTGASPPSVARDGDVHVGRASAADGDTLVLETRAGDVRIRLFGIDAPELDQTCLDARGRPYECGDAAKRRLRDLVEGRRLECEEVDRDPYERVVAICRRDDTDVNAILVREGYAWAFREFSERYVAEERQARAQRAGVWAGSAQPAWDHRRDERDALRATIPESGPRGCTIKGNISRSGRRLYHTQASPDWADTRVDTSSGERWFCSEAEARAAGWEPAYR